MPFIAEKVSDDPELSQYIIGFPKGLNTAQDAALVDDKNLIVATNVQISVDGIERRYGSTKPFSIAGSKVWASSPFYKRSTGVIQQIFIANGKLHYRENDSTSITTVSSPSFTNAETSFVQARDKLFIYNGTDNLRYWNGTAVTSYTALTTPAGLTVTPTYVDTLSVSSITRSSSTATATTASAHELLTGDYVTIAGASQTEYNGTYQITVTSSTTFTYTVSGTPVTPATGTITVTSGGVTAYSYRVSAFNLQGETLACVAVTTSTGPASLATDKYNKLSWSAVSSATGYNIYGRKSSGFGEVYLATVYETTWNDTGDATPITAKIPQDANNTGGVVAKFGIFTLGRQFVAGVYEGSTYHPCRLYYSGTAQYVDSFVGGEFGGGWVDVYPNDGGEIVDLQPFQNGVLVFKTNGLFKFYFDKATGYPALQEITRGHGGCSFKGSKATDNDIVYVAQKENKIQIMTAGQQENYVGDQIRTNSISVFIDDDLTNVNREYLTNIAAFTYDSKFGFAYTVTGNTENDRGYVLDTRFGGWVYWDGDPMECTHYSVYDDGTNVHLYGGSNNDSYITELMKSDRNDNGSAFRSIVGTKQYNAKMFDIPKIWRNPTFWFKYIAGGSIEVEAWTDGTRRSGTGRLSSSSWGAGAGADLAGGFLPGSMSASMVDAVVGADVPQVLDLLEISRSIGFYLIDENINTNWLLMGLHLMYTPLEGMPLEEKYHTEMS